MNKFKDNFNVFSKKKRSSAHPQILWKTSDFVVWPKIEREYYKRIDEGWFFLFWCEKLRNGCPRNAEVKLFFSLSLLLFNHHPHHPLIKNSHIWVSSLLITTNLLSPDENVRRRRRTAKWITYWTPLGCSNLWVSRFGKKCEQLYQK